ncbi:hypothetical protein BJ138DRAFT_1100691 [Hygrophoropsis aurantiaca]|uniref:Uncharacterized protein n=1 Tax=Hygrophoropsis aurantiaca TaxID=72124 RepID=A0ACB8AGQ8_9AGAM|nr:hypothetical protein BJ138DRAFT_1100691 [Hygrophoropsis aurantiaca]
MVGRSLHLVIALVIIQISFVCSLPHDIIGNRPVGEPRTLRGRPYRARKDHPITVSRQPFETYHHDSLEGLRPKGFLRTRRPSRSIVSSINPLQVDSMRGPRAVNEVNANYLSHAQRPRAPAIKSVTPEFHVFSSSKNKVIRSTSGYIAQPTPSSSAKHNTPQKKGRKEKIYKLSPGSE